MTLQKITMKIKVNIGKFDSTDFFASNLFSFGRKLLSYNFTLGYNLSLKVAYLLLISSLFQKALIRELSASEVA